LRELRLIGARVDLHQEIAGFDVLSLLKRDLGDLAVDPALHRDRVEGLHRAQPTDDDREIFRGCRCREHRHRSLLLSWLSSRLLPGL
jgi:hypothetical protein